jgi:hypothetical protein
MIRLMDILEEAMSSTERGRLYRKRHPRKVREYLRKTQGDRVIRNRDRRRAIKRHGVEKVREHDVHHPSGVGGVWRLARRHHGRDYVDPKDKRSKYR